MNDTIIVAILSFVGTLVGSFSGMKLMSYRIEQLEKKVEKHNNLVERVFRLEDNDQLFEEKLNTQGARIAKLENNA